MRINEKGLNLIKQFESCRLTAYKCPAGVWTIGYGHTEGVHPGMVITKQRAENLLKEDMTKYEGYVKQYCTSLNLNENEFSALVSFTYNCGVGNLKTLIRNRTKPQIAEALLLYNKAEGKVLNGLIRRRKAERELFLEPVENVNLEYYERYTGESSKIDTIFQKIGVPEKYIGKPSRRRPVAVANGLSANYKGSYQDNMQLIKLARQGKLKKV